jgi:transcriptional regulator of acetoin/glycerol metabolism
MSDSHRSLAIYRESFLRGESALEVRDEVLSSWRRSAAWAVDSEVLRAQVVDAFEPDERLIDAATTVIGRAIDSLSDLGVVFMLSDAQGLILGRWSADTPLLHWVERVNAVEGYSYAEEAVGSNAIGTAIEIGRTVRFDGHEHFVAAFRDFSCVGVPVRDPISRRLRGVLDVTAHTATANGLLRLVGEQIATAIEERLGEGVGARDRLLLQQFVQARRRTPGVIAINQRTIMSDPRATRLLGHIAQDDLWEHAGVTLESGKTVAREFAGVDGTTVHATTIPLFDAGEPIGVLMRVREAGVRSPTREPRIHSESTSSDFIGTSSRHLDAVAAGLTAITEGAVILTGQPGSGKRRLALELYRLRGHGPLTERDAAGNDTEGVASWLADIRAALSDRPGTLLVCHIECLAPATAHALGLAVRVAVERGWRVILTLNDVDDRMPPVGSFVRISVPGLDARAEDVPALIDFFARPGTVTPEATQLLSRIHWQGNIEQLQETVRSIRDRAGGERISMATLPPDIRARAARRWLSRIERVQVREMLNALAESDGNRQQAAETLGISRSTLYRRLRDAGIDLDKTAY